MTQFLRKLVLARALWMAKPCWLRGWQSVPRQPLQPSRYADRVEMTFWKDGLWITRRSDSSFEEQAEQQQQRASSPSCQSSALAARAHPQHGSLLVFLLRLASKWEPLQTGNKDWYWDKPAGLASDDCCLRRRMAGLRAVRTLGTACQIRDGQNEGAAACIVLYKGSRGAREAERTQSEGPLCARSERRCCTSARRGARSRQRCQLALPREEQLLQAALEGLHPHPRGQQLRRLCQKGLVPPRVALQQRAGRQAFQRVQLSAGLDQLRGGQGGGGGVSGRSAGIKAWPGVAQLSRPPFHAQAWQLPALLEAAHPGQQQAARTVAPSSLRQPFPACHASSCPPTASTPPAASPALSTLPARTLSSSRMYSASSCMEPKEERARW